MRKRNLRQTDQSSIRQRFFNRKNNVIERERSEFELIHSSDLGDTSYLEFLREQNLTGNEPLPSRTDEQRRLRTYDRWLNGAIMITAIMIVLLIVVAFFI